MRKAAKRLSHQPLGVYFLSKTEIYDIKRGRMSKSYLDEFRDCYVKTGRRQKTRLVCPKCGNNDISSIEIIRTAYPERINNRNAGEDYNCNSCSFKWKEMGEIIRPGIYIKTGIYDKEFTKNIAKEILKYLDDCFNILQEQYRNRQENDNNIFKSAIDEIEKIGRYVEEQFLIASRKGNIEERMVDYFWRVYRGQLDKYKKINISGVDAKNLGYQSDIYARMIICRNSPLKNMWELWI